MLLINSAWILWIALSVFFGYLIADAYFPDNMATFIPFSLIFLVFGGGVAYAVYRIFFKRRVAAARGITAACLKVRKNRALTTSALIA